MFWNITCTAFSCLRVSGVITVLNMPCISRRIKLHCFKNNIRTISLCGKLHAKQDKDSVKALVFKDYFEHPDGKSKETYLEAIRIYTSREVHRRGHVEFILSALSRMEEYGVHEDLEVYKALIDILPKGKFIPQNIFQASFMHYPKQQQCILQVLDQMEENAVLPDKETQDMLLNIFGKTSYPVKKMMRMLYWMPKFKHLSPWPLPRPVPNDSYELSQIAMERISSVDLQTTTVTYKTADIEDSLEDTWIISSQSPTQKNLLSKLPKSSPVYVDGPFRLWLREKSISYFVLRGDPPPPYTQPLPDIDDVSQLKVPIIDDPIAKTLEYRSVHEQDEAVIYAVCATGTSSRDSLLSWIRHLEKDGNPALADLVVLFPQGSPLGDVIQLGDAQSEKMQTESISQEKQKLTQSENVDVKDTQQTESKTESESLEQRKSSEAKET